MQRTLLALAFVPAVIAPVAEASCFTVVDRANRIVYRSEIPPVDLSAPIHQTLPRVFPGTLLIISDEVRMCTYIDPASPVDPMTGAAAAVEAPPQRVQQKPPAPEKQG
jgi:hypothetical protein